QPGRERLAVHARQLALQPHLQILRRSRRPLLCGMEQARRSALAHHVHRTAPMGPRVLINGIWYKCPVMQSQGITLSFHREMADSSRELVGSDVIAAVSLLRVSNTLQPAQSRQKFLKRSGAPKFDCRLLNCSESG